ncbi:MAG TPA: DUF11 domain-containing protein [Thermoanaerobaculia bacterium]|nr:DUF11 domain-containing protein [Thermoanaerobaculia bacterium]
MSLATFAVQASTADLSISKTTDTRKASARGPFTYTITVTNSGPGTAAGVVMTDVLPPKLRYFSRAIATTGGALFQCTTPAEGDNGTITCSAEQLPPGATATLTLRVLPAPDGVLGTITNIATVTSPTADPDLDDRVATAPEVELVPGAELFLHKQTAVTSARPGSLINYMLWVENRGPNAATNVVVTDVLPPELLFHAISPGAFTCTLPDVDTNGTITCTAPSLAGATTNGMGLLLRVAPDAKPGVVTNTASVTSATLNPTPGHTTAVSPPVTIAAPAGRERRLDLPATSTAMEQISPQVATTDENALAVWGDGFVSFAPQAQTASIRGALFRPDAAGETPIEFARPEFGTLYSYAVVAAAADRYLVVWRETKSSQGRLLARRLRTDGSFIDATPLVLETGTPVGCCTDFGDPRPSVASNGRDFYVTWVSETPAANDILGIPVPADGPPPDKPSILSRNVDPRSRGHYDVAVTWTSLMYSVVWLERAADPEPSLQQPFVFRYARVLPSGNLDRDAGNVIAGLDFKSITATPTADGVVVTVDYEEPAEVPDARRCVGVVLLSSIGQPVAVRELRCANSRRSLGGSIHSKLVPVFNGYLLVQPGRHYDLSYQDLFVQTSTADTHLTSLSAPTLLGVVARDVSVVNWRGAALLVYNRSDVDNAVTHAARAFAFLMRGASPKVRAVRR